MTGISTRHFLIGLARACGGTIIFALPLLMTNEMWQAGMSMHSGRLALFLALAIPLLTGLAYYAGFESSTSWKTAAAGAFVACAIAFPTAAGVLLLFGVVGPTTSANAFVSAVILQAIPGAIGAVLARSQLGAQDEQQEEERRRSTHWGELFTMVAGALFLGLNVAPTEEVVQIAYKLAPWQPLALAAVSVLLMHAFVYAVDFRGPAQARPGASAWNEFLRLSVVGYALALLVSLYVLWTFGRLDGQSLATTIVVVIVLGFPTAVGAAAARLIL